MQGFQGSNGSPCGPRSPVRAGDHADGRSVTLFLMHEDWDRARQDAGCAGTTSQDMHAGELEVSLPLHVDPSLVGETRHERDHLAFTTSLGSATRCQHIVADPGCRWPMARAVGLHVDHVMADGSLHQDLAARR